MQYSDLNLSTANNLVELTEQTYDLELNKNRQTFQSQQKLTEQQIQIQIQNSKSIGQRQISLIFPRKMNYSQHYYPQQQQHRQDPRIVKLKQDNLELEKALQQLNSCYEQKIAVLQSQLAKSKLRGEALLQWKSSYIDKELFQNYKYQQELQKMVKMMEEMAHNYQKQNQASRQQTQQKQEEISHLKDQNSYLRQQRDTQDQKIQTLAKKYIDEIQRLNNQLKQLKEQVSYDDNVESNDSSIEEGQEQPQLQGSGKMIVIDQGSYVQKQQSSGQLVQKAEQQNPLKDVSNHDNSRNLGKNQAYQKVGCLHISNNNLNQLIS